MAYENLDYTHLTPEQARTVEDVAKAIRNKAYGMDVREAIARALEIVSNAILLGGGQEALQLSIKLSDLSQEVKEALTGGAVAVVGRNSVGNENVKNKAISADKTDFIEVSPNLFDKTKADRGYMLSTTTGLPAPNTTMAISDFIPVVSGETYFKNRAGHFIEYDSNYNFIQGYGASHGARSYTLTPTAKYVRVSMGIGDVDTYQLELGSAGTPYKAYNTELSEKIKISQENIPESLTNGISTKIKNELLTGVKLKLEHGTVSAETLDKVSLSLSYARLVDTPYTLKQGEEIGLLDTTNYEMAFATEDSPYWLAAWNTTKYTAARDIKIAFQIRRKDGANVDLDDLSGKFYFNSNDRVATVADVKSSGGSGDVVRYVSLTGNDENTGASLASGFKTLQKAIDSGANRIYVQAGTYRDQTVNAVVDSVEIIVTDTTQGNSLAIFSGADTLTGWVSSDTVYRTTYSGNQRFNDVFVAKTLPVETTSSRPTYNAVLWEGDNLEDDYKMKPVLTLEECKAEVGTFFYDGTYVYVNPKNINSVFNATKMDIGIKLTGKKVKMTGIVSDYVTNIPVELRGVPNLELSACGALHSSSADGFSLSDSFGRLTLCTGSKNRNDGFNNHFTGDIVLENCFGINNYDDGASPHEECTMTVLGGEYRGNGKGGISPATGARGYVYNAKIIGNVFGIYNSDAGNGSVSSGNLIKDNTYAYLNTVDDFTVINDVRVNNGADFTSNSKVVDLY